MDADGNGRRSEQRPVCAAAVWRRIGRPNGTGLGGDAQAGILAQGAALGVVQHDARGGMTTLERRGSAGAFGRVRERRRAAAQRLQHQEEQGDRLDATSDRDADHASCTGWSRGTLARPRRA